MRKSRNSVAPWALLVLALVAIGVVARPAELVAADDTPRNDDFRFSDDEFFVNEGDELIVTVERVENGDEADGHNVLVKATDGSAMRPTHYTFPAAGVELVFDMEPERTLGIQTDEVDADKTFTITIDSVSEAGEPVVPSTATVTILDTDTLNPIITSLNPSSGPTAGGNVVQILGDNFTGVDCGEPSTGVSFGAEADVECTVMSDNRIDAEAPPGAGTVDVQVTHPTNGSNTDTGADDYTYVAPGIPNITSIGPNSGPAGITVTINGTSFTGVDCNPSGGLGVEFGGIDAASCNVNGAGTQITAVVPNPAAGLPTVRVVVTVAGNPSPDSAGDAFTYVDVVVTSISPESGPPGTVVTITGSGFTVQPTVTFAGQAATVNSFTPTSIQAVAPGNPAGTVDVLVTVGSDTSANTENDDFTYTSGISVTSLDPDTGPTAGGNTVHVFGTGFLAGATITVSFGGTAGTNVTRVSNTELTVVAPPHAVGTVSVRVTVNGIQSPDTSADDYTYAAIPVITSINPDEGPAGGTTIVTIIGVNFLPGSTVKFGAIEADTVIIISDTEIRAVAPDQAPPGTVDITVTNGAGTSATGAHTVFRFTGEGGIPTITNLDPDNAPTSTSGVEVVITGTNFSTPATVMFGTLEALDVEVMSSTEIRVVAPLRSTAGVVEVTVETEFGISSTAGSQNDFTYGAPTPDTTSYSLVVRFTLITWAGTNNMPVGAALLGRENPDIPATNNVTGIVTAVYYWAQDGVGCPSAGACWLAYFPSGVGVPGANNLLALVFSRAYWVAVHTNVTWTVLTGE